MQSALLCGCEQLSQQAFRLLPRLVPGTLPLVDERRADRPQDGAIVSAAGGGLMSFHASTVHFGEAGLDSRSAIARYSAALSISP